MHAVTKRGPGCVQGLREQLAQWEAEHHRVQGTRVISSGFPSLDRLLPRGGFLANQGVEWFMERPGSGAGLLALHVAARASQAARPHGQGLIVILDAVRTFYPPAVFACGITPRDLVVVRPRNESETLWAADQALRSSAVAAVWGVLPRIRARYGRRLQLAAESGNTLGLWIRPASMQPAPSWVDVQLLVRPLPTHDPNRGTERRWRIDVLRCRGGTGGSLEVFGGGAAAESTWPNQRQR